jgi:hypothetical protein
MDRILATELRQVTFTQSELLTAVLAHCRATRRNTPYGGGATCAVNEDASVTVRLEAFNVETDAKSIVQVELDRNEVGAALLRYCMAMRIPLPKRSQKSLQVTGDALAMVTRMEASGPPALGQQRM